MEFKSHLINDRFYPLKVWLSTLIVGSTIFVLFDSFGNLDLNIRDLFFSIVTLLISNLILGMPGLLVFIILFWNINNSKMKILLKIWLLIIIAFILFLLSWFILNSIFHREVFFNNKSIFIYFDFLFCIISSSFYFSFFNKSKKRPH